MKCLFNCFSHNWFSHKLDISPNARYARCEYYYKEMPDERFESFIKLRPEEEGDEEDMDQNFWYCQEPLELLRLMDPTNDVDFVVTKVLQFYDD